MKSNKILSLCLMSLGLYLSQDTQASNPAYEATVNAKSGLGSQEVSSVAIKGAPYTHWYGYAGSYYPENSTARLTKDGVDVWFDNVKKVSFASMIMLGRPYVKFATADKSTFYGIPRK